MSSPRSRVDGGTAHSPAYATVEVRVCREGRISTAPDHVAEEVPVALVYNGESHVVMMATPCDLEDFAYGFSVTEDIVGSIDEIESLSLAPVAGNAAGDTATSGFEIAMRIPPARQAALMQRRRNLQGRTGCGLCGAETIAEAIRAPRRVSAGVTIASGAIKRALDGMRQTQPINAATGATHAAAWASPDGLIVAVREDVGRHNALDKLVGYLLRRRTDLARGFLVITSRASYEMVQKAASVGMPTVVAISAPTAYAVRLAEDAGMTLIGFAQGQRQVIYSCAGRIAAPTTSSVS